MLPSLYMYYYNINYSLRAPPTCAAPQTPPRPTGMPMPAMMPLVTLILLLLLLASICAGDGACSVPAGRPSCVCDTGVKGVIDLTSIAGDGAPKLASLLR